MSIENERLAIPMDLELKWAKEKLLERDKQISKLVEENSKLREDLREDLREGISLHEPLSNVQLSKIWRKKYKTGFNPIKYYLFAEIFRDAEKAHGIGEV